MENQILGLLRRLCSGSKASPSLPVELTPKTTLLEGQEALDTLLQCLFASAVGCQLTDRNKLNDMRVTLLSLGDLWDLQLHTHKQSITFVQEWGTSPEIKVSFDAFCNILEHISRKAIFHDVRYMANWPLKANRLTLKNLHAVKVKSTDPIKYPYVGACVARAEGVWWAVSSHARNDDRIHQMFGRTLTVAEALV